MYGANLRSKIEEYSPIFVNYDSHSDNNEISNVDPFSSSNNYSAISVHHDWKTLENESVKSVINGVDEISLFVKSIYKTSCQLIYKSEVKEMAIGTGGFIDDCNQVITARHCIDLLPIEHLFVRAYNYDNNEVSFIDIPVKGRQDGDHGLDITTLYVEQTPESLEYCQPVNLDFSDEVLSGGHYVVIHFANGEHLVSVGEIEEGTSYDMFFQKIKLQAGNGSSGAFTLWKSLSGEVSAKAISIFRHMETWESPKRHLLNLNKFFQPFDSELVNPIERPYHITQRGYVLPIVRPLNNAESGYEFLFFLEGEFETENQKLHEYFNFLMQEYYRIKTFFIKTGKSDNRIYVIEDYVGKLKGKYDQSRPEGIISEELILETKKVAKEINESCETLKINYFDATGSDWVSFDKALKAIRTIHVISELEPANKDLPNIPVISFADCKSVFPSQLFRLIRRIFNSIDERGPFDQRPISERLNKHITSNWPGSLRSWHMNQDQSLPNIKGNLDKTNFIFKYLKKYSAPPKSDKEITEPIGFAEYTGICFGGGEPHDCKIVYNWVDDLLFLTLTHYQCYEAKDDGRIEKQSKKFGNNSPWFCIDREK